MAEYFTKDGDGYVEVTDQLLPQPEVDKIVEKRLERQRNQFADYDTLKEKANKVDTLAKDYEDKLKAVNTEKSELEQKVAKANLETEKVRIVHEFKLSDDLQEFVVGENAEEMRQRAEKLSKGVKGGTVAIDKKDKPKEGMTESKAIAGKLFGNKSDD